MAKDEPQDPQLSELEETPPDPTDEAESTPPDDEPAAEATEEVLRRSPGFGRRPR